VLWTLNIICLCYEVLNY